jgi:hypothetical protein
MCQHGKAICLSQYDLHFCKVPKFCLLLGLTRILNFVSVWGRLDQCLRWSLRANWEVARASGEVECTRGVLTSKAPLCTCPCSPGNSSQALYKGEGEEESHTSTVHVPGMWGHQYFHSTVLQALATVSWDPGTHMPEPTRLATWTEAWGLKVGEGCHIYLKSFP